MTTTAMVEKSELNRSHFQRKLPKGWKARFIRGLRKFLTPGTAADYAKVSRFTAFKYRDRDAKFAAAWDEAIQHALDKLESKLYLRGAFGWLEPVYQGGVRVGFKRKFNQGAAYFMLKGYRPEFKEGFVLQANNAIIGNVAISNVLASSPASSQASRPDIIEGQCPKVLPLLPGLPALPGIEGGPTPAPAAQHDSSPQAHHP